MSILGRIVLILLATSGLGLCIAIVLDEPMISIIFGAACTWTLIANIQGLLSAPEGQRFMASERYHRHFEPYFVRPIIRPIVRGSVWLYEATDALLEWLVGNLLKWTAIAVLALVGLALASGLAFLIFKSIAAIPVSLAIIIGAIIIASAMRKGGQ